MPIDPNNPPYELLRELLRAAFEPRALRRLCETPPFEGLRSQFSPTANLDDLIDAVFEFCRTQARWAELLNYVHEHAPETYLRFAPRLAAGRSGPGAGPPFNAPPLHRIAHFVGRQAELERLAHALRAGGVHFLSGLPGVGKTALATRLAHELREDFPGGVVWLSLETGPAPDTALTILLREFGLTPDPAAGLADQVRALLRQRHALLIADGAENAPAALAALLDSAGPGALLVTTRDQRLPPGHHRAERLPPLPPTQAARLLADLCRAEDPTYAAIARQLGRLPLALEIAAADMNADGTLPAEYLADLSSGALARLPAVQAAFRRSYERLGTEARRAFALLGLLGGQSFDLAAAAAGLDTDPAAARAALGQLVGRSLLGRDRDTGRYRAHPLLQEYAADAGRDEGAAMPARLSAHYLAYAEQYRGQQSAQAYDALEAELDNLLAVLDRAGATGATDGGADKRMVRDLTWALYWMLKTRGYWAELLRRLAALGTACEALGDRAGLATSYNNIGEIHRARGEYETALEWYGKCRVIVEELGDRAGLATTYNNIGLIHHARGDYEAALEWHQKALALREELGDRAGLAASYNNIGEIHRDRGDYEAALEWYGRSVALNEELGDRAGLATSYNNIGAIHDAQGKYEAALEWHQKALALREELGDRAGLATTYNNIGAIHEARREWPPAIALYERSLEIFERIGARPQAEIVRQNLARVRRAAARSR